MKKVSFKGDQILVDGQVVGQLSGRGEVYILLNNTEGELRTVARFKYRSPKAGAKHWVKFILGFYEPADLVHKLHIMRQETPIGLAEKHGYVSLNQLHVEKIKAEQDRLRNTPVTIVSMNDLLKEQRA